MEVAFEFEMLRFQDNIFCHPGPGYHFSWDGFFFPQNLSTEGFYRQFLWLLESSSRTLSALPTVARSRAAGATAESPGASLVNQGCGISHLSPSSEWEGKSLNKECCCLSLFSKLRQI